MENMSNPNPGRRTRNSVWVGALVLCAGVVMLLHRAGVFIPDWIFSWPFIFIVIGLIIGANHGFRSATSWAFIIIGCFFMARHQGWIPYELGRFFWPAVIILVGVFIIIRPYRAQAWKNGSWQHSSENSSDDMLDSVSVFTGVRRNITSKNFKRGEAVNIFGSTELNFMQADINGNAILDAVCIFGGIKLFVPADWEVQINVVHIFGGTEDKRPMQPNSSGKKVLMITGTTIFGGIDIRSY